MWCLQNKIIRNFWFLIQNKLISTVFWLPKNLIFLKRYVNLPNGSNTQKNFTFCHPVSHWKKRRIRVLRCNLVVRICGSGSIQKCHGSWSLGLIISFLYLQEERMFPWDTSSWTRRRGRSSTLMATEQDGSGRVWSNNPSHISSFSILAMTTSVSHNVILRFSHDYNPSAITSFSCLAMTTIRQP